MFRLDKLPIPKERATWLTIGLGLRALAALIVRISKKDPWMKRAVAEFEGIYRFENANGGFSHFMVFQNGKVKAPGKWAGHPDFTFTMYMPPSFYLKGNTSNPLELAITNKIGQEGERHYLLQFGFIMSLVERYFKKKA